MPTSGFLPYDSTLELKDRRKSLKISGNDVVLMDDKLSDDTRKYGTKRWVKLIQLNKNVLIPFLFTLLSFYLRFSGIERNQNVVWDEAHFGKFGSYYIKHEFYHDVHPPLGKMLIGLSEWLAGFDGNFEFDSGQQYPSDCNYKSIRQFNAVFGALCVPIAYFTAKEMGFEILTVCMITLMVCLEHSYIVLSKFILLDSMLLFFTILTFFCMIKIYTYRKVQFTTWWSLWMLFTGLSIGCVCSIKWVGLFVTSIVGLYTIVDLFSLHCNKSLGRIKYYRHWLVRIINLIVIPFLIYLFCFKLHFALLYKSGPGDAATNSLFQVNLEGNKIVQGPRTISYGSEVTIRSHGLSPNLLHSHIQLYPDGSRQRQVTGYGHSDNNNIWTFMFSKRSNLQLDDGLFNGKSIMIRDGDILRLQHKNTKSTLHSHEVSSHVSKGNFEVSGYNKNSNGDLNDDWIIEIVQQLNSRDPTYQNEDPNMIHPLSTHFRLKHKELGCYLATTGLSYPTWGFKQAEIVCKYSWSYRDKSTWWNVEDHWNPKLEISTHYKPPKSKFWTDFVVINFAMASTNNALIPDLDKYDRLASQAWEWPILHSGLRMCDWSPSTIKYYLLGSPFNTWISSFSIIMLILILTIQAIRWQRQIINFTEEELWSILICGVFPFISWLFHYIPFFIMGRVTYVHHYVPALYFAILIFGFVMNYSIGSTTLFIKSPIYIICFSTCIYIYIIFSPISEGMSDNSIHYKHLEWLSTWNIS